MGQPGFLKDLQLLTPRENRPDNERSGHRHCDQDQEPDAQPTFHSQTIKT
jgi:hypothetical protein